MVLKNNLKEKIMNGKLTFTVYVDIPYAGLMGMYGAIGYDGVIIDMEHSSIDIRTAEEIISVARGSSVTPLVRIPALNESIIGRLLDVGAQGIVAPHVESAEEAHKLVRATKFPPEGVRGWGGAHIRSNNFDGEVLSFGKAPYTNEYVKESNDSIMVVPLVESAKGIEAIEEIIQVEGVDAVSIGTGDLNVSLSFDKEATQEYFIRAYNACKSRSVGVNLVGKPDLKLFYKGCFYTIGVDSLLLCSSARSNLQQASKEAEKLFPDHTFVA